MTYDADERSVSDAQPAELYTITTPTTTYYLTSYDTDITFGGHTYSKAPIDRGSLTVDPIGQSREIVLTISLDHALAQDLLVGGVPQSLVSVRIDCLMLRAAVTRMLGTWSIVNIGSDGVHVTLVMHNALDVKVGGVRLPILVAQRLCNHGLFDPGCTLAQSSFQVATILVSVSVDGLTVTLAGVGGHPDQWAQFGKLINGTDSEPRAVLSQVGAVITIDVPFRSTTPGGSMTLVAGCDLSPYTCRDKFANVVNFGGHPLLPEDSIQSPTGIGVRIQS